MKYAAILLSAIVISITGCTATSGSSDSIEKSSVQSIRIVTVNPRYLSVEGKSVIYSPDSDRRKSRYVNWIFSKDEFFEKVGEPVKIGTVKIRTAVISTEEKRYIPQNKMASYPEGGFLYIVHNCRIMGIDK